MVQGGGVMGNIRTSRRHGSLEPTHAWHFRLYNAYCTYIELCDLNINISATFYDFRNTSPYFVWHIFVLSLNQNYWRANSSTNYCKHTKISNTCNYQIIVTRIKLDIYLIFDFLVRMHFKVVLRIQFPRNMFSLDNIFCFMRNKSWYANR